MCIRDRTERDQGDFGDSDAVERFPDLSNLSSRSQVMGTVGGRHRARMVASPTLPESSIPDQPTPVPVERATGDGGSANPRDVHGSATWDSGSASPRGSLCANIK